MKRLPDNFKMDKYGLQLRLVNEDDADFIVKLRTNPRKSRFIHLTDNDVEKQKEWIKKYKKREKEGLDYYFIYYLNGQPIGLNRLYNITETAFVGGSFIFEDGCPYECPIFATLIAFDIAFNMLGKLVDNGDIRLGNRKVLKFHKILGVEFTTQDDLNQYYVYTRDKFNSVKLEIERMLQ